MQVRVNNNSSADPGSQSQSNNSGNKTDGDVTDVDFEEVK